VARLAREHNDANVISFGGRIVGTEVAKACVREFLGAEFQGGRHTARVAKIGHVEAEETGR
jgi:ribose 5-phosphate isomerase B